MKAALSLGSATPPTTRSPRDTGVDSQQSRLLGTRTRQRITELGVSHLPLSRLTCGTWIQVEAQAQAHACASHVTVPVASDPALGEPELARTPFLQAPAKLGGDLF